jgi:hypothetical protein
MNKNCRRNYYEKLLAIARKIITSRANINTDFTLAISLYSFLLVSIHTQHYK